MDRQVIVRELQARLRDIMSSRDGGKSIWEAWARVIEYVNGKPILESHRYMEATDGIRLNQIVLAQREEDGVWVVTALNADRKFHYYRFTIFGPIRMSYEGSAEVCLDHLDDVNQPFDLLLLLDQFLIKVYEKARSIEEFTRDMASRSHKGLLAVLES